MNTLPFLLTMSVGFTHAFEADHLVAVSTIITRRPNVWLAMKDGVFWGLGHTSTILLVGSIFLFGRFTLYEDDFRYLEAAVGVMLVGLGAARIYKLLRGADGSAVKAGKLHMHVHTEQRHQHHEHRLSYGVGLMHGLAGSGALILSLLAQEKNGGAGLVYLMLFGIGSIGGMMVAAGGFSLPFSTRLTHNQSLRTALVILSSILCILLGGKVIWENL